MKKDKSKNNTTKFSRRDFIKTSAAGIGGAALVGISSKSSEASKISKKASQSPGVPSKWNYETDVVIVGYGLAGASAALTARESGVDVIVLEKMPKGKEGGNSKVSGNMHWMPDDYESGVRYFRGMCEGHMNDLPDIMVDTWCKGMMENRAWMESFGLRPVPIPSMVGFGPEMPYLPGGDRVTAYMMNGKMGDGVLWNPVDQRVLSSGIKMLYGTPGKELIATSDRQVLGVVAEQNGREITIKARRGVVLTCGGFEFNEAMMANYAPAINHGVGTPGNTGDGIKMAMALGADLWHMNNFMGPIFTGFLTDDLGPEWSKIPIMITIMKPNAMFVDKHGKRFMNEKKPSTHGHGWREVELYDGEKGEYPRIPYWIVFDESIRRSGSVAGTMMGLPAKMSWWGWHGDYKWSKDNSAEIKRGWIKQGNSVEELERAIGADSGNLVETFNRYGGFVEAGKDRDFGRHPGTLKELKPPFYAIPSWPCMVNTQGGPRRNHLAQILNAYGDPIPRLYSAGELGSIYAWLYNAGGNIGECMCFGRIAGRNAASQTPWG